MGLFEQVGLVAFDLEEVITAFFHDGPGVLTLTVQGIARDDFPIQSRQFFQQRGVPSFWS